jgi:hypothetical protein
VLIRTNFMRITYLLLMHSDRQRYHSGVTVEIRSGRRSCSARKNCRAFHLVTAYGHFDRVSSKQVDDYRTAIVTMLLVRAPEVTVSEAESPPDRPDGTTQLI